jgi:superfamily II DNA or RNA helicase
MSNSAVASPELQLSWHDDALHLWALHRDDGSVVHLVELIRLTDRLIGRHAATAALPTRIPVQLPPPLGLQPTPTLRMPLAALVELPETEPSATLHWFAAVATLADAVVSAGTIRPTLEVSGPIYTARWAPVIEHALQIALVQAHEVMPAASAVDNIEQFFATVVDAIARKRLGDMGWRPSPPQQARGTHYRAAQATFRALSSASGSVLYRTDDLPALGELARRFAFELDRAHGVPVVAPQLRLHLPDDADGPWGLTLELFDVDQPQRWCTAADIISHTALALDIARQPQFVDRLRTHIEAAGQMLGLRFDELEAFATMPTTTVELSLADVETFLTEAPSVLDELDVRLLGPEHLLRAKATVHATATPKPDVPSSGRFSAGALVQWDATIDDTPIDEAQLERAAAAGNSLVHVNGRWVRLDAEQVKATLGRLHKHRKEHGELDVAGLLKLAAEAASADAATDSAVALRTDGWIADLLAGLPDEQLEELHEPDNFVGELRHYQRRGLSWMGFLARIGLGGCLADDMGLGKTATALAHLSTRPGPHLVVCPLSVVHNWYAEAARFTPHLQVAIHHGGERARGNTVAEQLIPSDIVVTTYGLLARDIDALSEVRWGTLVLDEAQNVKNHLTRAARAVRHITADQKLALTGTPVENHLGELWAILDAVNPGLYGSASAFNDRYSKPIQRNGDVAATAALRALTQPFILRRTKADKTLLPELPDKIEQVAWATLTREQATMYQAVVDQLLADAQAETGMKRRGIVLAALTRLKQICNHPAHAAGDGSRLAARSGKLTRFDELVDDLLDVGERALVFTQFREMGLLLQRHLGERLHMEAPFLHGGVTRTGRDAMVKRFQSGDGPPLLLVSLKAGGTGLNLTAASQVIHYDRWWNPAVEDQATDRAWRLGQAHTVLVHKLVCEGTLEERISQLIEDKKQLANSVLGTGEQWLTELSTDALRSLVTLTPGTQL